MYRMMKLVLQKRREQIDRHIMPVFFPHGDKERVVLCNIERINFAHFRVVLKHLGVADGNAESVLHRELHGGDVWHIADISQIKATAAAKCLGTFGSALGVFRGN